MPAKNFKVNYEAVLAKMAEASSSCGRDPYETKLIAVSKFHPVEYLVDAFQAGCSIFGESRVQEALDKIPHLPLKCEWHFIGSLQSNKVAKVLPSFSLIHSVDTLHLAEKIAQVSQAPVSILLEVNVSGEKTKHGLSSSDWSSVLEKLNQLPHLNICGLMTMAPFKTDEKTIRSCFKRLCDLQLKWKGEMRDPSIFKQLSMGMSNDYEIAIQEGSTMVRIGRALFDGQ